MDTISAMAMCLSNQHKELMVFDWEKAAGLIVERRPQLARAGLENDWEYTGGDIYADGNPITDEYTYLASTWATPQLEVDGELIECYRMQSATPGWGPDTKWPESALEILRQQKQAPTNAHGQVWER